MTTMADGPDFRYDRVAALLHWVMAAMVIILVLTGLFSEDLEDIYGQAPTYFHVSLGLTVFALTVLRLAWRMSHRPPPMPLSMPRWQHVSAHGAHWLIYALMLLLPFSGYLFVSAGPYPLLWFSLTVPKLAVSEGVGELTHEFHEIGGITMAILLGLHIGAALVHQFISKDRLIARMSLLGTARAK